MSAFVKSTKRGELKAKIAMILLEYHFYAIDVLKQKSYQHRFDVSKYAEKILLVCEGNKI